jgi:hypothetical protein
LHLLYGVFEQVGDVAGVGGVPAVLVEQGPAEREFHEFRVTRQDAH